MTILESKALTHLLEMGFKKDTGEEYRRHIKTTNFAHPKEYAKAGWYVFEGNCSLKSDDFLSKDLQGLHIMIEGDLEVDGLLTDKRINGIIVTGDVRADNIILEHGPIEFSKTTYFDKVMLVLENKNSFAAMEIASPVGKLLFVDRSSSSIRNIKDNRNRIKLLCHLQYEWYWGNFDTLLRPEYLDQKKTETVETDEYEKAEFGVDKLQIHLPLRKELKAAVESNAVDKIFESNDALICEKEGKFKARAIEESVPTPRIENQVQVLREKLESFETRYQAAKKAWEVYRDDCEGTAIEKIDQLAITFLRPGVSKDKETEKDCQFLVLPEVYQTLVAEVGIFTIGENEFSLRGLSQAKETLGDLYRDTGTDQHTSNFSEGHYDEFLIFASYGCFPQQLDDYSDGLVFNRNNPTEVLRYACDTSWISAIEKDRTPLSREMIFSYVIERIDRLSERLNNSIEELNEEVAWYSENT